MMTTTTFDYNTLDKAVRDDVRKAAERIRGEIKRTAQGMFNIGNDLLAVQDKVGRGNWLRWLKAEFDMGQRTAYNFMAAAERFSKVANFANLPPSALIELINASDEAVAEVAAVVDAAPKKTGKVVSLAVVRAAKKANPKPAKPAPTNLTRRSKTKAPASNNKPKTTRQQSKESELEIKAPKELERVALANRMPADAFASKGENNPNSTRVCIWLKNECADMAKRNLAANNMTAQQVIAEAIAPWAAPAIEQDVVKVLANQPRAVDVGAGAGIDHDGKWRHVRLSNVEGRRDEWLGEHFALLVTAMREFVTTMPPNVDTNHAQKWLTHDAKNKSARQQKLAKAKREFLPLARQAIALLESLDVGVMQDA